MRRRILWIAGAIGVLIVIVVLATRPKPTSISVKERPQISKKESKEIKPLSKRGKVTKETPLPVSFSSALKLAERYVKEDKLLEAQRIYRELLQRYPDRPEVKEVEKKLWDLNIKILFSPIRTDYSIIYEVKPGDTLASIARRYNTTVELIKKSNGLKSDLIKVGQRLRVVNGKATIIIDKSQNTLTLKINDEIIKVYPCSTGKFNSTPTGKFKIVNKLVNPVWYKTGAIIPPESPENILGSRWMGLDLKGYGIHGTTQPETIGKQITDGCIRMYNRDAEELFDIVPIGTEVIIID